MRTSGVALSGARIRKMKRQRSQLSTQGWRLARPPPSWPQTPRRSTSTSRRRRRRPGSPRSGRLRGNETWPNNLTQNWYKDLNYSYPCPFPPSGKCRFFQPHLSFYFLPFSFLSDFQSCSSAGRLPDFSNYQVIITLTFLPLSHIHFSGSIFDDQWASPATPESPIIFSSLNLIHPTDSISSLCCVFWN